MTDNNSSSSNNQQSSSSSTNSTTANQASSAAVKPPYIPTPIRMTIMDKGLSMDRIERKSIVVPQK